MVSRSSINKVSVPAKAITRVAFHVDTVENWQKERYFILDSDYEAASVLPSLRDERQVNKLLLQMMQMIDVETKDSPPVRPQLSMISPPTLSL
jgi:hypothetical protein